ncbi:MAG: DMT family transporter [Sutterellaceae bacterium]|nr:DMT family transporter [Sutterellaceae bacterium]MDD7441643.1 DMT family transporter [Sutterellaceae bacterium]MDY2867973.1 DMT family transporter [Mesosutterella sp.]
MNTAGRTLAGVALASFAGMCFGAMGVAAQLLFRYYRFTPGDLVSIRLVGAGVILLLACWIFTRENLVAPFLHSARNIRDVLLVGAGFYLIQLTFFLSIDAGNAAIASLMVGFVPLFVILWLAVSARRRVKATELLCLALATAGVALLVTKGDFRSLDFSFLGTFWGIVSAGFGAFCTLMPRGLISRVGVGRAVGWGMVVGGLIGSIVRPPFGMDVDWSAGSVALYAFIVIFGTVLAFGCYLKSTELVPASVTSLLSCFEPLTSVVLTVILFSVPVNGWEMMGAVCVLANMVILSLEKER